MRIQNFIVVALFLTCVAEQTVVMVRAQTGGVQSRQSRESLEKKARSLAASANILYTKAQFKPAEPIVAELLEVLKEIPKFNDNSVAQAIAHRADLYYYANDSEHCIPLYLMELHMRDALHWQQFTDKDERFQIICERNRLGISYLSLKKYSAAEQILKRTLTEFQEWSGSKKVDSTTVSVIAIYAQCLKALGKTKEAETLESEVNQYNKEHPLQGRD